MLDIKSDYSWIQVNKNISYNNGQQGIDVYLTAGPELNSMREKVNQTFDAVELLKRVIQELKDEDELRKRNPALQEAWNHYRMIYALVKDPDMVDK